MELIEILEEGFYVIVKYGILLQEVVGVAVLITTTVKCAIKCIKGDDGARLELAHGIALALEFKLGGEVLRTVVVREWTELATLGAIILLRGALTLLTHWEIKTEEEHNARKPAEE